MPLRYVTRSRSLAGRRIFLCGVLSFRPHRKAKLHSACRALQIESSTPLKTSGAGARARIRGGGGGQPQIKRFRALLPEGCENTTEQQTEEENEKPPNGEK